MLVHFYFISAYKTKSDHHSDFYGLACMRARKKVFELTLQGHDQASKVLLGAFERRVVRGAPKRWIAMDVVLDPIMCVRPATGFVLPEFAICITHHASEEPLARNIQDECFDAKLLLNKCGRYRRPCRPLDELPVLNVGFLLATSTCHLPGDP